MKVSFTQMSPKLHRFSYQRSDGSGESVELETKSFLLHDFTHLALEKSAGLQNGFFGLLRQGKTLEELTKLDQSSSGEKETLDIERIVGPLSGFLESDLDLDDFMKLVDTMYESYKESVPSWVNKEVLLEVQTEYRKIKGEWNSLTFGKTLTVEFC